MSESKLPTEFGIFYPTGWIVAAFPEKESAEQVRGDLLSGGYDEDDCRLVRCDEVIPTAEGQLGDADWLSRLGKADEMLGRHLAAAKRGSTFLLIYAPTDTEAERVMNVVRRVPFDFAHRYRRFAIQEMK
jgi:hypothetical protein